MMVYPFKHLATVLISVFTLCYGPGLLFRGPLCISLTCFIKLLPFRVENWSYKINKNTAVLTVLSTFAKLRKGTLSFVMSVSQHGTRLALDGFSWNFIFQYFSKICREVSSFTEMDKE